MRILPGLHQAFRGDGGTLGCRLLMTCPRRSPRPREIERPYTEWKYDGISVEYLPLPPTMADPAFFSVVESRRSSQPFGRPSLLQLSTLLWFTCKTKLSTGARSSRWEHRPAPSAGGRHPIDLLITNRLDDSPSLHRYDPMGHALWRISVQDNLALEKLSTAAAEALGTRQGIMIWHAAQFARTTSKYEDGETLVWRDAGALLGVTVLVAEAMGLACCPVGVTGEPYLSDAVGSGEAITGVGGCVVGTTEPSEKTVPDVTMAVKTAPCESRPARRLPDH